MASGGNGGGLCEVVVDRWWWAVCFVFIYVQTVI